METLTHILIPMHLVKPNEDSDQWKFQSDLGRLIDQYPNLTVAQIIGVMEVVKWIWINRIPVEKTEDQSQN